MRQNGERTIDLPLVIQSDSKMHFNLIHNAITAVWHRNGLNGNISDLEKYSSSASTGSEAFFSIGRYLIDFERADKNAFELVKGHVNDYIRLCNASGLFFNKR